MSLDSIKEGLRAEIAAIEDKIQNLANNRTAIVKALELLTGAPPEVATPAVTAPVPTETTSPKKTAKTPKTKTGKRQRRGGPIKPRKNRAWAPGIGSLPSTQGVYDILVDGKSWTGSEVFEALRPRFPELTQLKVSSVLSSMRKSGLVTNTNGQWRRKYARHPDAPIETPPKSGTLHLKQLAEEGRVKELRPGVYDLGIKKPIATQN